MPPEAALPEPDAPQPAFVAPAPVKETYADSVWPAADEELPGTYPYAEPYAQPYPASAYREEPEQRSGLVGPLAIVAFVALGVMAIGMGVVISGLFSAGLAESTPSPTPLASVAPSTTPTVEATPSTTPAATPSPTPTPGQPVAFPDGFTADAQPCQEQPNSIDGCNSDGSTVSSDTIWVFIGFRNGGDGDTLSVSILDSTATSVRDGDIDLGGICADCNGYVRFRFSGLSAGSYTIKVERNGEFADEASFVVSG